MLNTTYDAPTCSPVDDGSTVKHNFYGFPIEPFRRRHAHVSAPSPPSCTASAALICGRHPLGLRHHVRTALRAPAGGTRTRPPAHAHVRPASAIKTEGARRASAGGSRTRPPADSLARVSNCLRGLGCPCCALGGPSPWTPRGTAASRCPFGPVLEHTLRVAACQFD